MMLGSQGFLSTSLLWALLFLLVASIPLANAKSFSKSESSDESSSSSSSSSEAGGDGQPDSSELAAFTGPVAAFTPDVDFKLLPPDYHNTKTGIKIIDGHPVRVKTIVSRHKGNESESDSYDKVYTDPDGNGLKEEHFESYSFDGAVPSDDDTEETKKEKKEKNAEALRHVQEMINKAGSTVVKKIQELLESIENKE